MFYVPFRLHIYLWCLDKSSPNFVCHRALTVCLKWNTCFSELPYSNQELSSSQRRKTTVSNLQNKRFKFIFYIILCNVSVYLYDNNVIRIRLRMKLYALVAQTLTLWLIQTCKCLHFWGYINSHLVPLLLFMRSADGSGWCDGNLA